MVGLRQPIQGRSTGRISSGQICRRKHPTEHKRAERQRACVNAEEGPATYNTYILEIEHIVTGDSFGFSDCLVIGTVGDREVGQGGGAG